MSFAIGQTVGEYNVLALVGRGGMGEVFKAEHAVTRRTEALKVLVSGCVAPEEEQRFLREIQLQASLSHPNIAAVYNAFRADDDLVMVMELVEGNTLADLLARGAAPPAEGIGYVLQALEALSYAHAHGIIHRDITPANLLITPDGVVKLTDFGLARSSADVRHGQHGVAAGSPYYMSPEQVKGTQPIDQRTDLYSMGAVLYEIVTGKRPFESDNGFSVMQAHVECAPKAPREIVPKISPALNDTILRALQKDPACRFASAAEFAGALRAGREPSPWPRALQSAVAVGAAVLAGALTGVLVQDSVHPVVPPPPPRITVPPSPPAAPAEPASPAVVPQSRLPRRDRRPSPFKPALPEPTVIAATSTPAEAATAPPPIVACEPPAAALKPVPRTEPPQAAPPPPEPADKKRRHFLRRALGKILSPFH